MYGFYDECKRRCNIKTWKTFIDVFNCLPIAAIVASKIFCVHGGLSPSLHSMDDIKRIQRPTDVPDYGLLNDLLWSDPSDTALDWEDNERGVSYCFGKGIINDFWYGTTSTSFAERIWSWRTVTSFGTTGHWSPCLARQTTVVVRCSSWSRDERV